MDIAKLRTANAIWDGKARCVVSQSAATSAVGTVSAHFGVEQTVLASANAQMDGPETIAARARSLRPCVNAQRTV